MADAVWRGGYADQHDPRYYPQHAHMQSVQYGMHSTPHGVDPHLMPPRDGYGAHPGDEGEWPAPPHGAGVARMLHGAGALLSVALIAGLAVWGYQLAMRDVTGVPVVRALAGPMRVQPEDPGGVAAAHQGLAVNTIAAEGQAEGPAPQVALAPAPVVLEEDDLPAHAVAEVSAVSMAEAGETALGEPPELAVEPVSLGEDEEGSLASALALANALSAGAMPLSGDPADLALTPEAEVRMAVALVPASVPGVARSPRPLARPDEIVARAVASPVELAVASAAAAMPGVREVAATEIAAGTRLVQLGAFDSEDVARVEWDKVALRFPEMLEGKDRVIEKAQSGGKTFYRLRAMGFDDIADARGFCAALTAGQAACIPVVTR